MGVKHIIAGSALVALLSACGKDNVVGPGDREEPVIEDGYTDDNGRIVFVDTRSGIEIPITVVDSTNGGGVAGAYLQKTELSHPGYGDFLYFSVEDTTKDLLPNFYFLESSNNGDGSVSMSSSSGGFVFGLFDGESIVKSFLGKMKDYFSLYLKTRLFDPAICSRQNGDITTYYDGTYQGNLISGASVIESGANRLITTIFFSSLDELVDAAELPEDIDRIVTIISDLGSKGVVSDYVGQIPGIGPALNDSLTGHVWDCYRQEEKKDFGINKEVHRVYRVSLPPKVMNSSVDIKGDSLIVNWDSYDALQYEDGAKDLTVECLPDESRKGNDLVSRVRVVNTDNGEDYLVETSGNRASFKLVGGNYLASLDVRDEVGNNDFVDLGNIIMERCETEYKHDGLNPGLMLQHIDPANWAFAVNFDLPSCLNPELVGFSFIDPGYYNGGVHYVDYRVFLGYDIGNDLLDLTLLVDSTYLAFNYPSIVSWGLREPISLTNDFYILVNGLDDLLWMSTSEDGDFRSSDIFLQSNSIGTLYSESPFNYRIRATVECCE